MTKYANPMLIQKDTSPYMYLTEYSGIYLNEYNSSTLFRGAKIRINESQAANHHLVSLQLWIRFPESEFLSSGNVFSIVVGLTTINFTYTPLTNSKKARITTTVPVRFYKNGNLSSSLIINAGEWSAIYMIFDQPIDFSGIVGELVLLPKFVFNNIAQYVYENEISTITTGYYAIWQNVLYPDLLNQTIFNTWQDINDAGSWGEAQYLEVTQNDYVISGDYIYGNQVGTSIVVGDDSSVVMPYANGTDIYANVEWQKIEKRLV